MTRAKDSEGLRALLLAIAHRVLDGQSEAQEAVPADVLRSAQALVTLERLSPLERAVFVLRDVFACGLPQTAAAVGCSEEACSQLAATVPGADDGSGAPPKWPRRIVGAENVARVLAATIPALVRLGITVEQQPIDGQPGVVFRDRNGEILNALALDIVDGRIQTIRVALGSEQAQ